MEAITVACDICGRRKQDTNHWLVAIVRPGYEGLIFQPAEATESPRNPLLVDEDLCGQTCAHTRFSRWMDDLKTAFSTQENEAA